MRSSLYCLLLVLAAFPLRGFTPARAGDPPPAKDPEDLVKKVSAAAKEKDFKTVRHYLTSDARTWLAFIEQGIERHARLEKALDAKFDKAPKGTTVRPPFTRGQLSEYFDLRLKGSKEEEGRAVLRVAVASDAKRTLKTYALPGKEGWKLFMIAMKFASPEPGEVLDLSTDKIKADLAKEMDRGRAWNDRVKKFTQRVEAGEFLTREEAEKSYRKDVLRDKEGTKDK